MSTVGDNRVAGESKAAETWLEVLGTVDSEPTRRGGRVVECGGLENLKTPFLSFSNSSLVSQYFTRPLSVSSLFEDNTD